MKLRVYSLLGLMLVASSVWWFQTTIAAPQDFPLPYQLSIENGQTLFSISRELAAAHAIRSKRLFELFMITLGAERRISEGDYYFDRPVTSFEIALRISGRQFGIERTRVTFPEGFTNKQMAQRLAAAFPGFSKELFLTFAQGSEGYLFPDTYSFFPSVTPDFVVAALKRNFAQKTQKLAQDISQSGRSLHDIMIMASIIEKEANGDEDRAIISGILWKRLDTGVPLQVDAPFLYVLGKESRELTRTDLAMNSLYNTYTHTGLPPAPIGNPGLASISAAIYPQQSAYLYYLHDASGGVHYAATYSEHKKNIAKFLK